MEKLFETMLSAIAKIDGYSVDQFASPPTVTDGESVLELTLLDKGLLDVGNGSFWEIQENETIQLPFRGARSHAFQNLSDMSDFLSQIFSQVPVERDANDNEAFD